MPEKFDISVVICTYNRSDILPASLASLTSQLVDNFRYEVIVVDNNSSDGTSAVVMGFAKVSRPPVRYHFERKQGLSHARNAGIAISRAPIVAFTDDDVSPRSDWLSMISQAFQTYPGAGFVGGRVLPSGVFDPPAWLTREHWAPLALVDYGDEPFMVNQERPLSLIGANIAFRKDIFSTMSFDPAVQRVKDGIGSAEDHELLTRLYESGVFGVYVPKIVVSSNLSPQRFGKHYHRRWHSGHGRFFAMMKLKDFERAKWNLLGVPSHLYREAVRNAFLWLTCLLRLDLDNAFLYETRLRFFLGFLRERASFPWPRTGAIESTL